MKHRMEAVEVYVTKENCVAIKGDDHGDGSPVIVIAPEQVEVIIQWMQDAKNNALRFRAEEAEHDSRVAQEDEQRSRS